MSIQLELISQQTIAGLPYQHLKIILTSPDGIVQPADLKSVKIPASLNPTQGVILEGKAPIWLYGCLVHLCHATAWVGCYDPRLGGAVVVESHQTGIGLGDVLKINLP